MCFSVLVKNIIMCDKTLTKFKFSYLELLLIENNRIWEGDNFLRN